MSPNGTLIFKEWGIFNAIKDKANIPYAASMRSYKDSLQLFSQPLGRQMEELYSAPYLIIHRAHLHGVLVQEADRLGVAIHLDSHFTRINFSDPSVELSNGKTYDAEIVLGADGERSACRDALLGYDISSRDDGERSACRDALLGYDISSRDDGERSACRDALLGYDISSRDSGDHVFRITVKASNGTEHKDMMDLVQPPYVNHWVGPGANAITYALKRNCLLNVVLTCACDVSKTIQHGLRKAEIHEASEVFGRWDDRFQTLLSLAQRCTKWTLLQTPEAPYWTHPDGKCALLGDSAHAMLPYLWIQSRPV